MRVASWQPWRYDIEFANLSQQNLLRAAEIVAEEARRRCPEAQPGWNVYKTGKYAGIKKYFLPRPIYRSGPYAGQTWTAREAGALKRTIRVVEKWNQYGKPLAEGRDVRVYAGNRDVYYAQIVEFFKPFMRPALRAARSGIKSLFARKAA